MISAISVKDRLKNQAVSDGRTMQEALTAYGLERTVYRLSVSEYRNFFTLKGGIFLYALFDGEFTRATRDIDLLAGRYDLEGEKLKEAVKETFKHRGTVFGDIFAFTDAFLESKIHQNRWEAFLKKKRTMIKVELRDVLVLLRMLFIPLIESITMGADCPKKCQHETGSWKE